MTAESRWSLGLLLLLSPPVAADQVILRNGSELEAEVAARTDETLVLEMDGGRLTLDREAVADVLPGPTAFGTYRARAQALAAQDAPGWLALAQWAQGNKLARQAREAYARVLLLDPENEDANRALDNVRFDGRWMTREDAYRAQGYVLFEDRWMLAEQRDELIRERAAAAEAARLEGLRREADARLAEAEARARDALLRLREVERRVLEAEAVAAMSTSPTCCGDSHGHDHGRRARSHDERISHRARHADRSDATRVRRRAR